MVNLPDIVLSWLSKPDEGVNKLVYSYPEWIKLVFKESSTHYVDMVEDFKGYGI
jgi:hypothetical protein